MKSAIKYVLALIFCLSFTIHNLYGNVDLKTQKVLVIFAGINESGEKTIKDIIQNILATYEINTKFERLPLSTPQNKLERYNKLSNIIKEYEPNLLIAVGNDFCNDNILADLEKNNDIPLIFCAFPWYIDMNATPSRNMTGMTEVDFIDKAVEYLGKFAKKDKISCIMPESEISRKNGRLYNELFFSAKLNIIYVKNFAEFKEVYLKVQNTSDMLIINNCADLTDWNQQEAEQYLRENIKIPSASNNQYMASMVLFSITKQYDEFGLYAAETTLKILIDGINPSELPVISNNRINITINMSVAEKLGLVIPYALLKTAHKIR